MDVKTFEGELTGEAIDIDKSPVNLDNFNQDGVSATLLAKSQVTSGSGTALVVAVGSYTVAGVITEATQGGTKKIVKKFDAAGEPVIDPETGK